MILIREPFKMFKYSTQVIIIKRNEATPVSIFSSGIPIRQFIGLKHINMIIFQLVTCVTMKTSP